VAKGLVLLPGVYVQVLKGLRLLVAGANLTDRRCAYDEGFYEAGRTYSATLLWSPRKD
jgi:hypothetical protein